MKEKKKKLIVFIIGLFLFPMVVYGKDYTYYYEELLNNNELVVHTDIELTSDENEWEFNNNISNYVSNYGISYSDISGTRYSYSLYSSNCNQDTMKCDFTLNLSSYKESDYPGTYESKEVKKYTDVQIKKDDTGVEKALNNLVTDNKLIINYDEDMFQEEYEKMNYISSYLNSKSIYNKKSYIYSNNAIYYKEMNDGIPTQVYTKKIDEVKFEYTETPYSDEFKELTSDGIITIKTNAELDQTLIRNYLSGAYFNSNNFELNGNVVGNKAYVIRYVYNDGEKEEKEKHLVTFKKGELDLDIFKKVGLNDKFEILAGKYDKNDITSYASSFSYNITNEDETHIDAYYVWDMTDTNKITFRSTTSDKDYNNKKYQYYVMPIEYVGYSKEVSADYKKLGDKIVVNSNDKTINTINEAINLNDYSVRVLNCNSEFSICDILIVNYETKQAENHQMKIEFNDEVSDYFKNAFNLGNDDTIDIIMSDDVNLYSISLYLYNDETNDSYQYYCYSGKCTLTLRNYYEKRNESHTIALNYIETGKSDYYRNNIVDLKTLYPGENKNYTYQLSGTSKFSKDKNFYSYANNCDIKKGICDVYVLTENHGIEVHKVNMDIKEGKSPEYESILPGDTIEVPYVENDNLNYIYNALTTYLNKQTKADVYVYNYENGKAEVIYNNLEIHSFNIKFAEKNDQVQEEIDKAAENIIKNVDEVVLEDLDLINSFYYSTTGDISIHDTVKSYKKIRDIINNNHISYQPSAMMGDGEPFASYAYANIILFYDGIGYGMTNDYISYVTRKVIYIPSNTKDTTEDYIKAAQKRINEYLGKDSGVIIQYANPIDEDYLEYTSIDLTNSDKNVYNLIHKDKMMEILIIKDDSKLEIPGSVAQDVNNNIFIEYNNINYPADTIVSTYVIGEDTQEYKDIVASLKVNTAQILDISLYSPTIGDITNFDGASFKVTVPITNQDLLDKKLVVYYIDENGKVVSEHPVTVVDSMATFETTHFSTYVLTEKKESIIDKLPDVPKTLDAIFIYVCVLGIGIAGMVMSTKYLKKQK